MNVCVGRRAALIVASAQPPSAPQIIDVEGTTGSGYGGGGGGRVIVPRGRIQNDCDGEVIPNPRPIQRLRILSGENTWGMCRDVTLPTLSGVAFCFGDFLRVSSHIHPTGAIEDNVTAAMAADISARASTAAPA